MGLLASFVFYYAPYALEAIRKSSLLLDRATYDPPATFFFLRNQMRDTVRILYNGYPLFVALSIGGWVLLCRPEVAGFYRRFLVAWGLTYGLMLILKDPALFPMIFSTRQGGSLLRLARLLVGRVVLDLPLGVPPLGQSHGRRCLSRCRAACDPGSTVLPPLSVGEMTLRTLRCIKLQPK